MKAAIKTTIIFAIALFTAQLSTAQAQDSKTQYCIKHTCYIVNPATAEKQQQFNADNQKAEKSAKLMLRNLINEIEMSIEYGQYLRQSSFVQNEDGSLTANVDFQKIFENYDLNYNEVKFIATAKTKENGSLRDVLLTASELQEGLTIYPDKNGEFKLELMFLLNDVSSERLNVTGNMQEYFSFAIPVKISEQNQLAAK
ncbi:MAG: hypothetical protein WD077_04055 [Bacteroidia bacterium]